MKNKFSTIRIDAETEKILKAAEEAGYKKTGFICAAIKEKAARDGLMDKWRGEKQVEAYDERAKKFFKKKK